ncbi:Toprim subdomain protein [Candidatus Methanomethylophilus alvi Mx1201]|uniref:Toprim subdomain protein n=3 Tax=Methanomethylophilus alvi TaxID=1291540 RepID=M9SH56_METAX|nr:Toprim subdomain protein [Candidatus Methanomethylophilus alvi Mx1201]AYQ54331.1 Toprim subdomain protein [Methanomethylophilus alvi]
MSDEVRLEEILKVLGRLKELSADHVILVEGRKDREALAYLGISGDVFQIQSSGGPSAAAEYVESRGGKAVILTDWDRRGGNLAATLRDILGRDNPDIDGSVREDLSRLSRHYIKDVEALDSLVDRLSADPRLL